MQLDRNALEKLLSLNDRQLKNVIQRLATENGIDLSSFPINPSDIQSIRLALSGATDEDLKKINEQYQAFHSQQKRSR